MTATDELRRMLDERGVEWDGESYESVTFWNEETNLAVASDDRDGKLWMSLRVTPEQAIEATLGRGTCHNAAPAYLDFLCSECGFVHYHSDENDDGEGNNWHYCPNCGAKVMGA